MNLCVYYCVLTFSYNSESYIQILLLTEIKLTRKCLLMRLNYSVHVNNCLLHHKHRDPPTKANSSKKSMLSRHL